MIFPLADWQFWTVTVTTIGALWMLIRPLLGGLSRSGSTNRGGGPCSRCGVPASAQCRGGSQTRHHLATLGSRR